MNKKASGRQQWDVSLFAPTADQRYLLGNDIFLRTHFPITLYHYAGDKSVHMVDEQALLDQLLHPAVNTRGNRLWAVYGAPGSGKSELIKWLETQIRQENQKRSTVTVRISRTELDVLSILQRFRPLLPPHFFPETLQQHWQFTRQKPRTLSKILLLYALENLFDSDEIINALFYRLINIIHPHILQIMETLQQERTTQSMEIISLEAWNTVIRETALPIPLEYEQFRHKLTVAFSQLLLGGLSLPKTLQQVSQHVNREYGMRPLLLIDDLVQSLNLFATDLLDYFITLEEGEWDVVMGLTPAAFEESQRGRHLLERIAYLDTIDDRIEKLWLSDEAGHTSSVLNEENCYKFAARYLTEYHSINGMKETQPLAPFNQEALIRIYRGLPDSKGKARYFLRHLRVILEETMRGESLLNATAKFAHTEYVARHEDYNLSRLCEVYGPLLTSEEQNEIALPSELLRTFGIRKKVTKMTIEPLFQMSMTRETTETPIEDKEKAAIRDWLRAEPVNRQLLHTLRLGGTRFLRTVGISTCIYFPNIATATGILNWQQPYLSIHPPLCIEGVDENEGIPLNRTIQHLAFDLYRYARATGKQANILESHLIDEPALQSFIFAADDFHQKKIRELEKQLGKSVERCAVSLYLWFTVFQSHLRAQVRLFPLSLIEEIKALPHAYIAEDEKNREIYFKEWAQFFNDFFQLREHLYDTPRIFTLCQDCTLQELLSDILTIDTTKIGKEYRWGKKVLGTVIAEWQAIMRQALAYEPESGLPLHLQEWINRIIEAGTGGLALGDIPKEILLAFAQTRSERSDRLRVYLAVDNSKKSPK